MDGNNSFESDTITCGICAKKCLISKEKSGACGKYTVSEGRIVEINPRKYLTVCAISIETMPILHFYPGGKFLQITTTGCNFKCEGCVSTVFVRELDNESEALKFYSSEDLIDMARKEDCIGITFIMNDPLASYYSFLETAKLAKESGLLTGCSSNGFFTDVSARFLGQYLDFVNIGMKGSDDESYVKCGACSVTPVFKTIQKFYNMGVHLEISVVLTNKNRESVERLALFLASTDKNIPFQIMRFMPLEGASKEDEPSIKEAEEFCLKLRSVLNYVYLFNSPGTELLTTECPHCGKELIKRDFYGPMGAKVKEINRKDLPTCRNCRTVINIPLCEKQKNFREEGFSGGYPFTRGLEIIQSILISIGVNRLSDVVKVWESTLKREGLSGLHEDIRNIPNFINLILKYGQLCNQEDNSRRLALYMTEVIEEINQKTAGSSRPRVYYFMGKPLFGLNGSRFENVLVHAVGGYSVNTELDLNGRPGESIPVKTLNKLNPEIMIVSSFFGNNLTDIYEDCQLKGIDCSAVRNEKIRVHPYPNIDFGSPRWILGLMNLANIIHPELFNYDLRAEAEFFYREFYKSEFDPEDINLSFAKPHNRWNWEGDVLTVERRS